MAGAGVEAGAGAEGETKAGAESRAEAEARAEAEGNIETTAGDEGEAGAYPPPFLLSCSSLPPVSSTVPTCCGLGRYYLSIYLPSLAGWPDGLFMSDARRSLSVDRTS